MSHKFLLNSNFHSLLIAIDRELAEQERLKGCSCGGSLHQANYARSPIGLPADFRAAFDSRYSLCCSVCRKRVTPPSVRFFGRRWYPAALFLLISALRLGVNECRLSQLKRHFGIRVSESTWKRWRRWWREIFVEKPFWKQNCGLVPEPRRPVTIVGRMLHVFTGDLENKMLILLKFILPMTTNY